MGAPARNSSGARWVRVPAPLMLGVRDDWSKTLARPKSPSLAKKWGQWRRGGVDDEWGERLRRGDGGLARRQQLRRRRRALAAVHAGGRWRHPRRRRARPWPNPASHFGTKPARCCGSDLSITLSALMSPWTTFMVWRCPTADATPSSTSSTDERSRPSIPLGRAAWNRRRRSASAKVPWSQSCGRSTWMGLSKGRRGWGGSG
jgi:hypothetical protein